MIKVRRSSLNRVTFRLVDLHDVKMARQAGAAHAHPLTRSFDMPQRCHSPEGEFSRFQADEGGARVFPSAQWRLHRMGLRAQICSTRLKWQEEKALADVELWRFIHPS